MSNAHALHGKSEQAREDGNFLEALKLSDEATLAYQEEKDYLGLSEIQASRSLIFSHLYEKSNDKNFLILAESASTTAVKIAEDCGLQEALALPYFNLAKVQEKLGQTEEALDSYQKALNFMNSNPPKDHNRPAVLADMKGHLAAARYIVGEKTALQDAIDVLAEIENSDEDSYNKNVWSSGSYMRIADMLRSDDPETAKQYLQKAKEIIDSDERLKLRLGQWTELSKKFN